MKQLVSQGWRSEVPLPLSPWLPIKCVAKKNLKSPSKLKWTNHSYTNTNCCKLHWLYDNLSQLQMFKTAFLFTEVSSRGLHVCIPPGLLSHRCPCHACWIKLQRKTSVSQQSPDNDEHAIVWFVLRHTHLSFSLLTRWRWSSIMCSDGGLKWDMTTRNSSKPIASTVPSPFWWKFLKTTEQILTFYPSSHCICAAQE